MSFEDNQGIFEEGLELVRRLWQAEDRISHHGKYYSFEDVRIPGSVGIAHTREQKEVSHPAARAMLLAEFAITMRYRGEEKTTDIPLSLPDC